jgi:tetratricopeptide (TPR) repeat protein
MKLIRPATLALVCLAGSAMSLTAQAFDPAEFEHELVRIVDLETLLGMAEERTRAEARSDRDAQLALGMILVRRWELEGDDELLDRAREAFARARDVAPDDPWAHWGYGLALARGPDVRSGGAVLATTGRSWAATLGIDARSRATRALEKALALDARFDRAAAVLAEIALQERDTAAMRRAYDILLRVLSTRRASDHSLAMLTRVADLLGDHETALRAGEAVGNRPASTPDQIHAYALALLRTEGREADGAVAWFAAVDRADPATMARLWAETSPIARESEKEHWDALQGMEARREFLRNIWGVRAGIAALPVSERLAEHYIRLAVALERYRRRSGGPMLAHAINQKWPDAPVDERGVMYIRHGEPKEIIRTAPLLSPSSAMCPSLTGERVVLGSPDGKRWRAPTDWRTSASVDNESWVYEGEDGRNRLMNFLRCRGFTDYAVPYDVPCGDKWMEERKGYDMDLRYCGMETRERVRAYTREAFVTDTDKPAFDAIIPFSYDLLAFRGAGGQTDLSAPVAMLADSLIADTVAGGALAYSVDLAMFIVDTINSTVATSDTTLRYRFETRPARNEAIVAYINIAVDPTPDALQRIVVKETARPGRGRVHGQHILVPGFSADSLQLSTIVLAVPGEGGNWRRGSTELAVMPIGEFRGGNFRAFYEVYNLEAEARYETEITVERVRDARDRLVEPGERLTPVIQLRFQDVAAPDANGVIQELRSVESDLEPGQYNIHVRVRNLDTRQTAVTERLLTVR